MSTLKKFEAVKGLIIFKYKFLVLEKSNFIGGKYEVPGGRKNLGETDEGTLKREVMEETGLEIEIEKLLNNWSIDLPKTGIHLDGKTYLCESKSDEVKLSEEHISYKWIGKDELKELDCPDWLRDAISKLG